MVFVMYPSYVLLQNNTQYTSFFFTKKTFYSHYIRLEYKKYIKCFFQSKSRLMSHLLPSLPPLTTPTI